MAIYLDYEGIKGNVTAESYEGMIALKYFTFNASRKISMEPGAMENRENTLPKLGTVYIEKFSDVSTAALFNVSVAGSEGKRAMLHFVRTGTHKPVEYMTNTLENCLFSEYFIFHIDRIKAPHEKIYLSYTSLEISAIARDAKNRATGISQHNYNLVTAAGG